MLEILKKAGYIGPVEIDGEKFPSISDAQEAYKNYKSVLHIKPLWPIRDHEEPPAFFATTVSASSASSVPRLTTGRKYEITVKKYMLLPSTKDFDFHEKFNNNVPVPVRTSSAIILRKQKSLYRVRLHAFSRPQATCLHCGLKITNPISLLMGIGPTCAQSLRLPRYASRDEIDDNFSFLQKKMKRIAWEGFIPEKGIISAVPIAGETANLRYP